MAMDSSVSNSLQDRAVSPATTLIEIACRQELAMKQLAYVPCTGDILLCIKKDLFFTYVGLQLHVPMCSKNHCTHKGVQTDRNYMHMRMQICDSTYAVSSDMCRCNAFLCLCYCYLVLLSKVAIYYHIFQFISNILLCAVLSCSGITNI